MKSLRRSLNSDKSSSAAAAFTPSTAGSSTASLPLGTRMPVSTTAPGGKVAPPQKVIKALSTFKSDAPQSLSYNKGDFFFITGEMQGDERNPAGFYQALNPITGSRGRVPRDQFEEFNKGGRAPSGSISGGAGQGARPHSPAGASSLPTSYRAAPQDPQPPQSAPVTMGPRMGGSAPTGAASRASSGTSTSQPKKAANPLYAIVQYDFEAERPDELDAKAGEPIIVIAQSNHEWFVAKPIGRLGGPGLIPVSFVEIRDPTTGKSVENVQDLLASGLIPPVEEWKKSTAEYKAASIPLGRFDFGPAGGVDAGGMPATSSSAGNRSTSESHGQSQGPRVSNQSASVGQMGGQRTNGPVGPSNDLLLSHGEIVAANVVSFHHEANEYWFRINAIFLPDRRSSGSSDARSLVLYRLYEDFYNFQITLLDLFPQEAGRTDGAAGAPPERILPFMPGPLEEVNVEITSARREDLDTYLNELLALRSFAPYILQHDHVLAFFSPNQGDQVSRISREEAMSRVEQQAHSRQVEEQMVNLRMGEDERLQSRQSRDREQEFFGRGPSRSSGNGRGTPSTQRSSRGDSPLPSIGNEAHRPPSASARASGGAQPSAMFSPGISTGTGTTASWGSNAGPSTSNGGGGPQPQIRTSGSNAPPVSATAQQPAFIKIKVLDRTTDDMIAIRVPPRVTFAQLLEKVRDRLGAGVGSLQYRRQGGSFTDLNGDDGLAEWLRAEEKLVLYAQ